MTKEEKREYNKKWREAHPDYQKQYWKQYRLENKDELREKDKQYRQTKEGRAVMLVGGYSRNDRLKGFDTSENITRDWLIANVFSGQKCVYCGETDWKKLGTDRIDNTKPHTPENCVCCCWDCNNERKNRYTFEKFKELKNLR